MVKNLPANAGDMGDAGSIPGSGRSLEEGMATHFSVLAWRNPWTEEPGRLQSMGSQRVTCYLAPKQVCSKRFKFGAISFIQSFLGIKWEIYEWEKKEQRVRDNNIYHMCMCVKKDKHSKNPIIYR